MNLGASQPGGSAGISAFDPNTLINTGGTLGIKTGPTIAIASGSLEILQGNSVAAPGGYSASRTFGINGFPASSNVMVLDSYAGTPAVAMRRQNGTAGTPTALAASDVTATFEGGGYDGVAWPFTAIWQTYAIENYTTAAHGSAMTFSVVLSGTTSQQSPLLVTGQSGQATVLINRGNAILSAPVGSAALQVIGGTSSDALSVGNAGSFVANGTTAVTVVATGVTANSVIIPSVKTPGGTVGSAPHVGTISAGVNFTMISNALDTSTYSYVILN